RLRLEQNINSLFVPALQNSYASGEGDLSAILHVRLIWQVKPVNGVKKELGADTLVQVLARAPEPLELSTLVEQSARMRGPARILERAIADFRIPGQDHLGQPRHARRPFSLSSMFRKATASRSCESTSTRSAPLSASASCARSSPYFTPMS